MFNHRSCASLPAFNAVFGLFLVCASTLTVAATEAQSPFKPILASIDASSSQRFVQQTPLVSFGDNIFLTFLQKSKTGKDEGVELRTVVMKGTSKQGAWTWESHTLDDKTVYDRWHTAPAIGIDDKGYVHVAYNMHNLPWQYQISNEPLSINDFTFRGQHVSIAELERMKFENKTDFPTLGLAAIPGNQITYPAFFNDRQGRLFVSYRFAAKPALKFEDRTMSSGIARYDSEKQQWHAMGVWLPSWPGDFKQSSNKNQEPQAIAAASGWTSYFPRLTFGPDDSININVFWREGIAAATLTRPCFITSEDQTNFLDASGHKAVLPITPQTCGNLGFDNDMEFYGIGNSTSDSQGNAYLLLSPVEASRTIVFQTEDGWESIDSPDGATEIFFDGNDNLWAIAPGLKLFVRARQSQTQLSKNWQAVFKPASKTHCGPRAVLNGNATKAFVYAYQCFSDQLDVFEVNLADIELVD